jgi:hypothetical protein
MSGLSHDSAQTWSMNPHSSHSRKEAVTVPNNMLLVYKGSGELWALRAFVVPKEEASA